jgi:MFS family permease
VPTYAQTQLHSSTLVGSTLSAIIDLGMIIGRITLGLAADSKLGTMNSVISGMVLAGLCPLVFWLPASNSLPLLYVFCFSYGFLGGGYIGYEQVTVVCVSDISAAFYPQSWPSSLTLTSCRRSQASSGPASCRGRYFLDYSSTQQYHSPVLQLAGGPIAGFILSSGNGQWTPVILFSGITIFCGSLFAVATRFQGLSHKFTCSYFIVN